MKLVVFLTVFALVFFSAGYLKADDISDMKAQIKALQETINAQQKTIEALNAKIQTVETKQESQAKEIKKVPELAQEVGELKESKSPAEVLLDGVSVGGHLKIYMADRTQGERNGDNQHTNLSAGINHFYLFLSKEIEDWLKIDVQTDTSVSASATPSIGSNIERAKTSSTSTTIYQAFMTTRLPQEVEMKFGVFNPMFSEEYAKETWWHELYHQNTGLANLQSWHDTGVEFYKNFDFEKWSLPVYFNILNGNTGDKNTDNNDDKGVLVHVAPELFQTKLRLLHSFAYGKWDDGGEDADDRAFQYVNGFDWKYQKFNLTGEYIYRKWNNLVTTGLTRADGKREGFWLRGMYNFTDKWRGLVKYSHAELYKTGSSTMKSDNYDTTSLAVNYLLTPNSTIIGQYQYIDGDRSDGSESLKANRVTLGWRTTF